MTDGEKPDRFAVVCEERGEERPLYLHDLTFARLLEEVVIPFDQGEMFFVDGVPVSKEKIRRLKILRQEADFRNDFRILHRMLIRGDKDQMKTASQNYYVQLDSLFRNRCEDVTAQVVKAFNTAIKPSISDYIPKRTELIDSATRIFVESLKYLSAT